MPSCRIIGGGRVGLSFAHALDDTAWSVVEILGRADDVTNAAEAVELVVLATPDDMVAQVAEQIVGQPTTVVAHVSGSLGLDVLEPHERRGSMHPLATIPNEVIGTTRLRSGIGFALDGDDELLQSLVEDLGGVPFRVDASDRAIYHATAVVAANHIVALLGQVERLAASIDLPLDPFLDLVDQSLEGVRLVGPAAALTGPAARGDIETLRRHLAALPDAEHNCYLAVAREAARLASTEASLDALPRR